MNRVESWSETRVGTLVTLRRGALTGERVERTKAWTASGPYYSESGVACIRVDIGGAVVSYPLDRVSLGWTDPPVSIAATLDPPPAPAIPFGAVDWLVITGAAYFVSLGLAAIAGWIFR